MEPNKFTQFFGALNTFLSGKKTYLITALAVVYIFGAEQCWWKLSEAILYLLGFGGIAALRAGLGKALPILFLAFMPFGSMAQAVYLTPNVYREGVKLAWDHSAGTNVSGYNIYQGGASRKYTNRVFVGYATGTEITNLTAGTFYFTATAVTPMGVESDFSNEVAYTVESPIKPPAVNVVEGSVWWATNVSGPWALWTNFPVVMWTNNGTTKFFRSAIAIR